MATARSTPGRVAMMLAQRPTGADSLVSADSTMGRNVVARAGEREHNRGLSRITV